jgi:hypothetical protein
MVARNRRSVDPLIYFVVQKRRLGHPLRDAYGTGPVRVRAQAPGFLYELRTMSGVTVRRQPPSFSAMPSGPQGSNS